MPAKLTTSEFIKRSNLKHSDKYDYSNSIFIGSHIKVIISCPFHGKFEQTPANHLSGKGCRKCSTDNIVKIRKFTNSIFIEKANKVHNFKYDYSLVEYNGQRKKVKIICRKHGVFEQAPIDHWQEKGCPRCKLSKGEDLIMDFLDRNKINYKAQFAIDGCLSKSKLRFDFAVMDNKSNIKFLIEFDGIGHYKAQSNWGGEKSFFEQKDRDAIKNKFCKDNNIKLLRIPYWKFKNIENILIKELPL